MLVRLFATAHAVRLINTILLAVVTAILLWAAKADAQYNGNLPYVYQSTNAEALSCGTAFCWANNVRAGDYFACWANWDTQGTVTSQTWSDTGALVTFTTQPAILGKGSLGFGQVQQVTQMVIGVATGSGSTSFVMSPGFPRLGQSGCIEISPPNGATLSFDTHNECTGNGVVTCALTATASNDVFACVVATPDIDTVVSPSQSSVAPQFGNSVNARWPGTESFGIGGAAGSQSCAFNTGNNANYYSVLGIAFKPSTLTIGTSQMPNGATGVGYSAQFVANTPFAGALTWSVTLPSTACGGITMNSSTGVYSGANPTTAGTCSGTASVTDGTHTATQPFEFQIAGSLQTIQTPVCTTYTVNPAGQIINAVKVGDTLFATALEIDTHGQNGQLNPASDMTDSPCGDTFTIQNPVVGGQQGGLVIYAAKAKCSGNVQLVQTLPGGTDPTPLVGIFCKVSGAQNVIDTMSVANSQPNATTGSLNTSLTTPVVNEQVFAVAATNQSASPSSFTGCSTIQSASSSFGNMLLCEQSAPTAGAYAITGNFSGSGSFVDTTPVMAEFALRPEVPSSVSTLGEKKRRHPE